MLTPRIFCFTGDGSSEELTQEKFLGVFYSKEFFLGSSLSRPSYLRGGYGSSFLCLRNYLILSLLLIHFLLTSSQFPKFTGKLDYRSISILFFPSQRLLRTFLNVYFRVTKDFRALTQKICQSAELSVRTSWLTGIFSISMFGNLKLQLIGHRESAFWDVIFSSIAYFFYSHCFLKMCYLVAS
jgi:hypothetical protein